MTRFPRAGNFHSWTLAARASCVPAHGRPFHAAERTGGRVAEGTGLENRHTGEPGIVGSNPTLSASHHPWDGWPSGLRRTPGKRVDVKASREFESRPIRAPRLSLVLRRGFAFRPSNARSFHIVVSNWSRNAHFADAASRSLDRRSLRLGELLHADAGKLTILHLRRAFFAPGTSRASAPHWARSRIREHRHRGRIDKCASGRRKA